jgi:hypothetical protein
VAGAVERAVEIGLVDGEKLLERGKESIPSQSTWRRMMTVSHVNSVFASKAERRLALSRCTPSVLPTLQRYAEDRDVLEASHMGCQDGIEQIPDGEWEHTLKTNVSCPQ